MDASPMAPDFGAISCATWPPSPRIALVLIGELTWRNPGIADLLTDLETDDHLRARFEIELLGQSRA
jgi:hypothetical protein